MRIGPIGGQPDPEFEQSNGGGATQPISPLAPQSQGPLSGLKKWQRPPAVIPDTDPSLQHTAEPDRISVGPPPETVSPLIFMTVPYRPLPRRMGASDGGFLVPRIQNYEPHPEFIRRMAAAGDRATELLHAAIARGNVTPEQVRAVLQTLGDDRRAIAMDLPHDAGVHNYGRTVAPDDRIIDRVLNDLADRHFAYFERATNWADVVLALYDLRGQIAKQEIDIPIQGEIQRAPLSFPLKFFSGTATINHPTGREAAPLINHALKLFADVLNDPALAEEHAMQKLGGAHYLLMHGPPFQRGTPSIVETLIDATLRARHGVGLPPKREHIEPFWEAIFTPGTMLSDYARNFRNFFE